MSIKDSASSKRSKHYASELSPEYALMGFLYLEPMHGYELHHRLQLHLREVWRIPMNQAYNLLKRMEKEGLIKGEAHPASAGKPRVLFSLTGAGRARFEAWLAAPTACSNRALRVEFLTRLFFARHISVELPQRLLQEQGEAIEAALHRLEERLNSIPAGQEFNRFSLELRKSQLLNLQAWFNNNRRSLEHNPVNHNGSTPGRLDEP